MNARAIHQVRKVSPTLFYHLYKLLPLYYSLQTHTDIILGTSVALMTGIFYIICISFTHKVLLEKKKKVIYLLPHFRHICVPVVCLLKSQNLSACLSVCI